MHLYDSLFHPYPYQREKYGHAQFGWGGGQEHQTMTFIVDFERDLMHHELAHQWFGDMVTCRSFHDIWLNEGFATYLTGLNYEHRNDFLNWKTYYLTDITNLPGGSVYCTDTTNVDAIFNGRTSYSKGAYVLHMMRKKVGDQNFFAACRNYLSDPLLTYGYATTADLKRHMEAVSGVDLTQFLQEWYYGQGYPIYNAYWWQPSAGNGTLKLNQTTSHNSVRFYHMNVPVQFKGLGGRDTLLYFAHDSSGQVFHFNLPFTVTSVSIDPNLDIVHKTTRITGISQTAVQGHLVKLSPNPVTDNLYFDLDEAQLPGLKAEMYSPAGALLKTFEPRSGIAYPLNDLASGMYLVKLTARNFVSNTRIVKQ